MEAYIAMEGFTLPSGFVIKELTILYTNGEYDHHLFLPPTSRYLSEVDKTTIRYTTSKINQLSWTDGAIPYSCVDDILNKLKDCKIFTFSGISLKTLQKYLPTAVIINIQDFGFEMPSLLPHPHCFRAHSHRYCAKAKAFAIKHFMEN